MKFPHQWIFLGFSTVFLSLHPLIERYTIPLFALLLLQRKMTTWRSELLMTAWFVTLALVGVIGVRCFGIKL